MPRPPKPKDTHQTYVRKHLALKPEEAKISDEICKQQKTSPTQLYRKHVLGALKK